MSSKRRIVQMLLSLVLFVVFAGALLYQFSVTANALGYDQPQLQQEITRQGNIIGTPRPGALTPTNVEATPSDSSSGGGGGMCSSASILVVGACFLTLNQRKRTKSM